MEQKPSKITLLWVSSRVGIPGNETADEAVKEVLDEEIQHNEKYLPHDEKQTPRRTTKKRKDQLPQ
jgi:ribonuclease HI